MSNKNMFPLICSIEGTGYEGRNDRIEFVKEGDPLTLKVDYNNKFYSPVAIEVFNAKGETLGYLCNCGMTSADGSTTIWLENLAMIADELDAIVASVTPLSQRSSKAKYALMDVCLNVKESAIEYFENVNYKYSLKLQYYDEILCKDVVKSIKNKFDSAGDAESYVFDFADEHDLYETIYTIIDANGNEVETCAYCR